MSGIHIYQQGYFNVIDLKKEKKMMFFFCITGNRLQIYSET